MTQAPNTIPAEVVAAIQRGELIQAIKLLRQAKAGIGLKEAKDLLDAHLRGAPTAVTPPVNRAAAPKIPLAVMEALRRGNKLDAIRLLHTLSGIGLKEAKEQVEALEQTSAAKPYQTGMVVMPKSAGLERWVFLAAIIGLAAYYLLNGQA